MLNLVTVLAAEAAALVRKDLGARGMWTERRRDETGRDVRWKALASFKYWMSMESMTKEKDAPAGAD